MNGWAEKLFYTFSAVFLTAALFTLQASSVPDVAKFQADVKEQFKFASIQVLGDQPLFDDVGFVISSINQFYVMSADATIAILAPAPSENDLAFVAQGVYREFAAVFNSDTAQPQILGVETSEPILLSKNLMPQIKIQPTAPPTPYVVTTFTKTITQSSANFVTAVNDDGSTWVNLRDNSTGQVYCVAIFNAEVNRYIGPCKNDYY